MRTAAFALGVTLLVLTTAGSASAQSVTAGGFVSLLEEAQIAAQESGILNKVVVRDGQQVTAGERVALIDPTLAILEKKVRETELDVAHKRVKDTVRVEWAKAAARVYERDYWRKREANRIVPGSVPQADVEMANLEYQQYRLQADKESFELEIRALEVKVSQATLDAAEEHILRHEITAPWDGVVEKVIRHTGDWVKPGDPVLRLVRMDRLWVMCKISAAAHSPDQLIGQAVSITIADVAGAGKEAFQGKVVGVSPLVEADNKYGIWAEVENRKHNGYWVLRDGMRANMTIRLKR